MRFLRIEASGCCEKGYFEEVVRPEVLKRFESKEPEYKPYFVVNIVKNAQPTFEHFEYRNDPTVVYTVWSTYED